MTCHEDAEREPVHYQMPALEQEEPKSAYHRNNLRSRTFYVGSRGDAPRAKRDARYAAQVQRGREIADKVCWICHVTGEIRNIRRS